MLRDGVSLDLDDLSALNFIGGTVADGLLVLLDSRAVDNGSSSNTNVVVLGEDPSIEIGRDIITDIHLCHLLVKLHLLVGDLNTLLESDGEVVLSSIHGLSNAAVGSIGTDDQIKLTALGSSRGVASLILLEVDGVRLLANLVVLGDLDGGDKSLDALGSIIDGTITEIFVHDLTTTHADVLIRLEGVSDVNLYSSGGDEVHLAHLTVDNILRDIEFANHTQRNSSSARLGIIKLTLEHGGLDVLVLSENLSSTGSRGSSSDNSDTVLHVQSAGALGTVELGSSESTGNREELCKGDG
mmetsp:Transcript_26347/g.40808  ORF Transcript_26347/g.40808 Transcript_26347/m.40808 type:complete len:298 (+) Transcript_26347:630-1523(+)